MDFILQLLYRYVLTIDLEIDDLADPGTDLILGLAQVVTLAVLADVLELQGSVAVVVDVHVAVVVVDVLVLSGMFSCHKNNCSGRRYCPRGDHFVEQFNY